jgi:hypothetical protein
MACFPAPNNGLFRWHGRMSSALGSRATPVEKKKKSLRELNIMTFLD